MFATLKLKCNEESGDSMSEVPPIKRAILLRGISPLIFRRTDVTQIGIPSSSIVKYLDVFKQAQFGFLLRVVILTGTILHTGLVGKSNSCYIGLPW